MPAELVAICHKYPPYASGGLAPYLHRSLTAVRQARPGVPVRVITLNHPGNLPRRSVAGDGLVILRPPVPGFLKRRFLLADKDFRRSGRLWFGLTMLWFNLSAIACLLRDRPRPGGVVAVHDWQSSPAGIVAALLGLPVAYHIHNTEFTMTQTGSAQDPLGLIRRCERTLGRVARIVVVPTPELRDLLGRHGWDLGRVSVVPHGFEDPQDGACGAADPTGLAGPLRQQLNLPAAAPVLVFAGRLSRVKGILTLIEALPAVAAAHPLIRLLVLGVGFPGSGESRMVHQAVARTGMQDRVLVYDAYLAHRAVMQHYALADVCVFPSTFEPFGLVSVEAMSLGRPVVLGPGFSDLIAQADDGPAAARTRTGSPAELAQVLIGLMDDPAGRAALGERGRRHVRTELTWARSTERLLNRYDAISGSGSGSGATAGPADPAPDPRSDTTTNIDTTTETG